MFLPSKQSEAALADRIIAALTKEIGIMSQQLTALIASLGTNVDQVIALLQTDNSAIASLQAANDALKTEQGDDSAQVAEVQGLINKLTAVLPAVAPEPLPEPVPESPVAADGTGGAGNAVVGS